MAAVNKYSWVLWLLFVTSFPFFLHASNTDYPTANTSSSWINNDFIPKGTSHFTDGSILRPVLLNNSKPACGCGFYGNPQTVGSFFFVIFAVEAAYDSTIDTGNSPAILWTANRVNPVGENATLKLTSKGDLVLRDADDRFVWSSNTSSKSVSQMQITANGTLMLIDLQDSIIWQSWNNPTDTWLPDQILVPGQRLIASVSASNWTPGPFFLSVVGEYVCAFTEANPPQMYHKIHYDEDGKSMEFITGRLEIFSNGSRSSGVQYLSTPEKFHFMRFEHDGFLRVYEWNQGRAQEIDDIFHESSKKKLNQIALILGPILAALVLTFLIIWICVAIIRKRKHSVAEGRENNLDEDWGNSLDMLSNLPRRFTYKDLKSATDNFCRKLGEGGFGSVFEGTLGNGTKIAVKRLDRLGQGRKEFLAEVKTIGSIHHVNLVQLMGFCAEKLHRLLVYEHMSNGSLDKWIFHRTLETALEWEIRKKIILNIAKGLAYLHEDCRMRIAHLDVKPQNILLDDSLNAKLSDFGLARLIDKNQSQVITQMRGTRGYMAPEWLSRKITEKVDVYSFGVVVLEIVCGRKNLDFSQPEEDDHLLIHIVKRKAQENRLLDLVDKCSADMQQHGEEAVKMIMVAIWCLHVDFTRRPSMSMVVKVLEGGMVMEPISDYSFLTSTVVEAPVEAIMVASTPQPASILSGPR